MTTEKCSKCGRARPTYIADPTCPNGAGYCTWEFGREPKRIVFNVAGLEVVRIQGTIVGERWVQLRFFHNGDDGPLIVQLPERAWDVACKSP